MKKMAFFLLTVLLFPAFLLAYNIDPSQVTITSAGHQISSESYRILVSGEKTAGGLVSSPNFVTQVGWIYTIINYAPSVGEIQVCDGSCGLVKSLAPESPFTVRAVIEDRDGQNDLNTESFHVEFYTASDVNGSSEDWDHNTMTILDDPVSLGNGNGCVQSGSVYCINVPGSSWTTKFLNGDANLYVRVDDNSEARDWNALTSGTLSVQGVTSRAEDSTAGTYNADPGTPDNAFESTETGNEYILSTHTGNLNLDVTVFATDLNTIEFNIKDENQSWHIFNVVGDSTPFTGSHDTIISNWTRGTYPDLNTQEVYYWLDVPSGTPKGAYTGFLTYDSQQS